MKPPANSKQSPKKTKAAKPTAAQLLAKLKPNPDIPTPPPRTSRPGHRTRRDNGPNIFDITAVQPPPLQQIGQTTLLTRQIIEGGPQAIIAAQEKAEEYAKRFGSDFEAHWFLKTKWLSDRENGTPTIDNGFPSNRKRLHNSPDLPSELNEITPTIRVPAGAMVRHALQWRPTFLAVKALTRSTILAAKAAGISQFTADWHRRQDSEFDGQCLAAEEYAVQLLHDVTFKSALEGECEPVLWQGIPVAWVRKVDNRLRIEMLRAYMPNRFKTPGGDRNSAPASTSIQVQNGVICTPEVAAMIMKARQANLAIHAAELGITPPNPVP